MSKAKTQNEETAPAAAAAQDQQAGDAGAAVTESALPADGQQEQPPAPPPTEAPPEGAAQEELGDQAEPKDDGVEAMREEIRTQLAAHLETLRGDVNAFLENEVRPLREDIDAMGKVITKLEETLASVDAEAAGALLAEVRGAIAELPARVLKIEQQIKHFV